MGIKFKGSWDRVKRWLNDLSTSKRTQDVYGDAIRLGEVVKKSIIKHIMAQDLNWKELSEYTKKRKGHNRKYQDTLGFVKSINSTVYKTSDGYKILVYPKGINYRGIDYSKIAFWLEKGTKKGARQYIPPRPLWNPTLQELSKDGLVGFQIKTILDRFADA